ncbi:MAG: hypothetical protein ACI9C2_001512 [Gammaproteobacteria bacterium]|jgi:hypothetical protein
MSRPLFALAALVALSSNALAQTSTFAEGFDTGSNEGGWRWGTTNEFINPLNGNPGPYLRDTSLVTHGPSLRTTWGINSMFSGDYKAMGVTEVGVDLITEYSSIGVGGRPLTLYLWNDSGTPGNFSDDWGATFVGTKNIPSAGSPSFTSAGWTDFVFTVDSAASSKPAGWKMFGNPSKGWKDLMADVDAVEFYAGIPGQIYLVGSWQVGMDNPRITFADCDGNGMPDSEDLASGALDLDGNGELDACQFLSVDVASISATTGGTQSFTLDAGAGHAGEFYFLAGSASGTTPGFSVGGLNVPLNIDNYTLFTLQAYNTPTLTGTFGSLDAAGKGSASVTLGAGFSALVGLNLTHAFVTLDALTFTATNVSNTMPLTIVL